jgi:hypothetical protein
LHLIFDVFEVSLEVLFSTMQKALRLQVCSTKGQEVNSSEPCLLAGRHKDDCRKLWGVLADGMVNRFDHGHQTGGRVSDGEALDVQLQWDWSHIRVEAEEAVGAGTKPLAQVLRVGDRGAEGYNANLVLNL